MSLVLQLILHDRELVRHPAYKVLVLLVSITTLESVFHFFDGLGTAVGLPDPELWGRVSCVQFFSIPIHT